MRKKVGSIEDITYYGINTINPEAEIALKLKDYLLIYRTVEELRRFFHNRDHFPDINKVYEFMDGDSGMFKILNKIYIDVLDKTQTNDIEKILESDSFLSNLIPFYYLKKEDSDEKNI